MGDMLCGDDVRSWLLKNKTKQNKSFFTEGKAEDEVLIFDILIIVSHFARKQLFPVLALNLHYQRYFAAHFQSIYSAMKHPLNAM